MKITYIFTGQFIARLAENTLSMFAELFVWEGFKAARYFQARKDLITQVWGALTSKITAKVRIDEVLRTKLDGMRKMILTPPIGGLLDEKSLFDGTTVTSFSKLPTTFLQTKKNNVFIKPWHARSATGPT